ncbi:MAG TPA: histidine kinase [Chitinophagaceae bacterium]
MKIAIKKERIQLYLKIALAYLFLWLFMDLLQHADKTYGYRIINNIWLISYLVVLNFILFEYLVPFIKWKWKRLLLTPFLIFPMLMLYSFGLYGWRSAGIGLGLYSPFIEHKNTMEGVEYHVPYGFFSILFFGVVKYTYDLRKLKEQAQRLQIEKQQAELNYLKSQTNPHFLFNTLNNIYSLSRIKSDLASESILRLSKILRFMLYETSGQYIAIEKEIKIISDYIELERLRYDETLRVDFSYDIEDMKQALPPLLMIPLVENAFKHGVSESRSLPFVDVHLSVRKRQLSFTVGNSAEFVGNHERVKENIGLSNLRRQLELLYADYDLSLEQKNGVFTAILKINLASHV